MRVSLLLSLSFIFHSAGLAGPELVFTLPSFKPNRLAGPRSGIGLLAMITEKQKPPTSRQEFINRGFPDVEVHRPTDHPADPTDASVVVLNADLLKMLTQIDQRWLSSLPEITSMNEYYPKVAYPVTQRTMMNLETEDQANTFKQMLELYEQMVGKPLLVPAADEGRDIPWARAYLMLYLNTHVPQWKEALSSDKIESVAIRLWNGFRILKPHLYYVSAHPTVSLRATPSRCAFSIPFVLPKQLLLF